MADKFGFGGVSPILKSKGHYPGQQYSAIGERLVIPGLSTSSDFLNYDFTFGEIVKVHRYDTPAYEIAPIDDSVDAVANLAVIMRDVVGGTAYNEDIIPRPKRNVPLSLFLLNPEQYGSIAVVCSDDAGLLVNGTPHLGLGTGGTVAGTVYGAPQGALGVDTLEMEGWEFKTLAYEPSLTRAKAVIIGRVV